MFEKTPSTSSISSSSSAWTQGALNASVATKAAIKNCRAALASVVGARYLAIGTGDTELYVFAGMLAAVVISIRVFLFRGAGKAN